MNKTELINALASSADIKKNDARKALDAFLNIVADVLQSGDKLSLPGFGSFEVIERKERSGRNPRTGEEITIPASKMVKFKVGKSLKESVK